MLISEEYRKLNVEMHSKYPGYGSKGHKWQDRIRKFRMDHPKLKIRTILDYGAGKGSLYRALGADFDVREYDPGVPGKAMRPVPADLVVCTDVLEHVEPECLNEVIRDIVSLSKRAALVAVACRAGKRVHSDGRSDHLIVKSEEWWHKRLNGIAPFTQIRSIRKREYAGVYIR
jgi:hypothetical protein